jgi:hypothetical protein
MSRSMLCSCALFLAACQSSANSSSAPPPVVAPSGLSTAPAATSVASISVSDALRMAPDSVVQVKGLYLGWNGPCMGRPPTRSAWQLTDSDAPGAACIYVDGPALPGVQPNAPPPNLVVLVHGRLVVDGALLYVRAEHVERQ